MFPQILLLTDTFCLQKIIADPHILAQVNTEFPDDRYAKLKMYILEMASGSYISSVCNKVLHDWTSTTMTVARSVGTGSLLIRYTNGHTKKTHRQLKNFHNYC